MKTIRIGETWTNEEFNSGLKAAMKRMKWGCMAMAMAIDYLDIRGLRKAHLKQLASYIRARDQGDGGGWYYGNKATFEARHEDLIKLADELERIAADDDIVISPKENTEEAQ